MGTEAFKCQFGYLPPIFASREQEFGDQSVKQQVRNSRQVVAQQQPNAITGLILCYGPINNLLFTAESQKPNSCCTALLSYSDKQTGNFQTCLVPSRSICPSTFSSLSQNRANLCSASIYSPLHPALVCSHHPTRF